MHELSLTQSLVAAVAARAGDRRVQAVQLRVGPLSGVSVEAIRFCFDLCAQDTVLAAARLDVAEANGDEFIIESMEVFDV